MFGKTVLSVAIAALAIPCAAEAQLLKVVEVNAPKVNCVFQTDCNIPVTDTISNINLPFLATPGTAWVQSRTFAGDAGAPGAGTTGYEYRISMTQASGAGCILGFNLNFGPHKELAYFLTRHLREVVDIEAAHRAVTHPLIPRHSFPRSRTRCGDAKAA